MATTSFRQVQAYLDHLLVSWREKHHRRADVRDAHGDGGMRWRTREQLLSARPFGVELVAPNTPGRETNLYLALTRGIPAFPRMPLGGPYLPEDQCEYIATWIDEGMPE